MLRAVIANPGAIEFSDVAKPSAADGEVLVRILRIGICGSDIHVFHGKHPYTSYPVVQGHEFCGEVVETGRNVTTVSPGDLVTASPQITCGTCPPCREGKYNICDSLRVIGFQAPGVAQEYFAFPESAVLKLPEGTTPEMGALVEPAAVAMHAVGRAGDVTGKRVLVLGAGTIGNLVAQVAQCRGAGEVLLTDISDYRLEIARASASATRSTRGWRRPAPKHASFWGRPMSSWNAWARPRPRPRRCTACGKAASSSS